MRICSKRNLGLAIALCLSAAATQAAENYTLDNDAVAGINNAGQSSVQSAIASPGATNALVSLLGPNESFAMAPARAVIGNELREKGQQTWNGIQVLNGEFITTWAQDGSMSYVTGNLVQGIDNDLTSSQPIFTAARALEIAKSQFNTTAIANTTVTSKAPVDLWVMRSPSTGRAVLAYRVQLVVANDSQISQPVIFVNANNQLIETQWDNHQTVRASATGPGGNVRTGQYEHNAATGLGGTLVIDKTNTTCRLANADTQVINARNGQGNGGAATAFNCAGTTNRFTEPTVNGGFGVQADILDFGTRTIALYRALGVPDALGPRCGAVLNQYAHVMVRYDNAFYTNCEMRYGDGNSFYPLVSTDVVAHEISHGVTEFFSGLVYAQQSGGLNESYSDMAGAAFTFTVIGRPDFNIGSQISKNGQPLRFMATPSRDGSSIDSVSGFRTNMDPHFSSGPFNRAYTILAQRPGWTPVTAFQVFLAANRDFYTANSTFVAAGNGACQAVTRLNNNGQAPQFNPADVRAALQAIGLNPQGCGNGGGTPNPGGNVLQNNVPVSVGTLATGATRTFTVTVPGGRPTITVRVTGNSGDADLYVRRGAAPTTTVNDGKSEGPTSNETVTLNVPATGGTYNILLNGFATASGVSIVATF